MKQGIRRTLLIVVTSIGLAQTATSVCFGWSLLHPFSSGDQPKTTMVSRTTEKPPSTWQKLTSGTKNFFNKTGETLGLKKKPPRKPPAVVAPKPRTVLPPQRSTDGGIAGWLWPKEEKPKDVKGWLDSTKQVTP